MSLQVWFASREAARVGVLPRNRTATCARSCAAVEDRTQHTETQLNPERFWSLSATLDSQLVAIPYISLHCLLCLNRGSTGWRPAPYPDCDARITAQPSRTGRDTLKRNFVTWFSDPHPWLSYVGRTPWRVQSCKWLVNDSSTCQDQRSRFGGNHARCDHLATASLALELNLVESFFGSFSAP
jgi:hypothetical protein